MNLIEKLVYIVYIVYIYVLYTIFDKKCVKTPKALDYVYNLDALE